MMKKNELEKMLKKLREFFINDTDALNALKILDQKCAEIKVLDRRDLDQDDLNLPAEMQELSLGFAIFADGACRGNPGPGAWGTIIQNARGEIILKSSGVDVPTTNNKMELQGIIRGLNGLIEKWTEDGMADREAPVFVYSDSKYVIDGINSWVLGWKKRGWKKADNKDPENLLLWQELDHLKSQFLNLSFHWVKGHAGHPQNELCDQMANLALDEAGF